MGATKNEVSWIREARDHQDRRAVAPASQADAGSVGYCTPDLLSLVRLLHRGRPGGAGGPAIGTKPSVEQDPDGHPRPDYRTGAGSVRTLPAGAGGALHR